MFSTALLHDLRIITLKLLTYKCMTITFACRTAGENLGVHVQCRVVVLLYILYMYHVNGSSREQLEAILQIFSLF